jgi:type IV pilus assembly protein PilB
VPTPKKYGYLRADEDVIYFVEEILQEAVVQNASDIHIEPYEKNVRVRYRIDGCLQEKNRFTKEISERMTVRIKILAKLDISERRLPQDGSWSQQIAGKRIDFRLSTIPTLYGEKLTIRLIYDLDNLLAIDQLHFYPDEHKKFIRLIEQPYGMVLFTGPTGCGKSTTLATTMNYLSDEKRHLITIEDPVEKRLEGVNQMAIHPKIGLTFAGCLRAILRQDPDVIMLGEIRDQETANIAVRAAITGHLVLSTLHTNDAASTLVRLKEMGVESYFVSSAVKGVLAQRLLRRICPSCKQSYSSGLKENLRVGIPLGTTLYQGEGCEACRGTGYKGRFAIHEILVVDEQFSALLAKDSLTGLELKKLACQKGMRTLWENAYESMLLGETTVEELLKIG